MSGSIDSHLIEARPAKAGIRIVLFVILL